MKKLVYLVVVIAFVACNQSNQTVVESTADTSAQVENKNIDNVLKNDSLKMIEKEKELLEKYK